MAELESENWAEIIRQEQKKMDEYSIKLRTQNQQRREKRKYILLENNSEHPPIKISHRTLYPIQAVRDFTNEFGGKVVAGQIGGHIEYADPLDNSNNCIGCLSHEGTCWIDKGACVFDGGRVSGDAWVSGKAWVTGNINEDVAPVAFEISSGRIDGDQYDWITHESHLSSVGSNNPGVREPRIFQEPSSSSSSS